MKVGIDIGGSTTDIAGFENGRLISCLTVKASDPISSAAGALGRYLVETKRNLGDINTLAVTGVGAGALGDELLGIPVSRVDEFRAIGRGGVYLSGVKSAVVASLGTGTAFVEVDGDKISHWGGSGVGGGTLIGLSKALFGVSDIELIAKKAAAGRIEKVDLSVGDIATQEIPGLLPDTTASNFAKLSEDATDDDLAMAVVNLVCQTVGMIAKGAAGETGHKIVVLVGKLAAFPAAAGVFRKLGELYDIEYRIAPNASFATAVGAAVEAGGLG